METREESNFLKTTQQMGVELIFIFFPPPGLGIFSKVPQLLVTYADANLGLREIQRVRAGDKEVLFSN